MVKEYSLQMAKELSHSLGHCLPTSRLQQYTNILYFNKESGWISNEHQDYLIWIPSSYRAQLWHPAYVAVMGKQMLTLDLQDFVWGESWVKCWKP
ncbi:hypothetical protein M422DRAFT_276505 [Sphaerobolus stellatus SS14]|uniref:Uncharacterized protein n=1 Tax=Sphaerobolus stellatus (strain SS14) TaxID=990650 RepID=A0A0C9UC30_SPHS4|nr:hypothetical protein M422DRAFT_276505 [Sphaerobolus stellatus SS14]